MSERWIPILAASIGLLGGMGGALVGGSVANEGQRQQFENEQAARAQDLRRSAFADFLQEAANVEFSEKQEYVVDKLIGAEAKLGLFANSEVRNEARALVDVVRGRSDCDPNTEDCYATAQGRFVDAATAQLESGE